MGCNCGVQSCSVAESYSGAIEHLHVMFHGGTHDQSSGVGVHVEWRLSMQHDVCAEYTSNLTGGGLN